MYSHKYNWHKYIFKDTLNTKKKKKKKKKVKKEEELLSIIQKCLTILIHFVDEFL